MLFIPILVDAYVLPRAGLAIFFGGLLFGLGALAPARRGLGLGRPMAAAVAMVVAAAALAWLFSINPSLSLAGAYSRYESLIVRLAYLGLFCGGAWVLWGRARRWVENAFLVGCSIASVEAFYQWASHSPFRPDGNLGQAGLLGGLLAMAVPLSLQAGFRYRPWLLTLPVLCAGLLVSTSRAGWLGAVLSCFVLFAFAARSAQRRRLVLGLGVLAAVAALAVLVASPLRSLNSDTGSARLGVWSDALHLAAARPLTGWGEDATGLAFGRFQSADWEPGNTFDRIHDQPLDLLVTQGLAGSLAALTMWGLFWLRAWRAAARERLPDGVPGLLGAVAAYQCWALINFDWAPATGPAFLLAGAAWAAISSTDTSRQLRAAARPRVRVLMAGAVALIAALSSGVLAVLPVLADRAYYAGANATAVALDPLQARYHQALGEQLGVTTPRGLAELRHAFDLGDYDYSFCIELGDAALRAGNRSLARAAYVRADQVYRFDPTARERLQAMATS